ncbi:hypothetical protein [Halorubrum sp. AS12]|uniref:hypothetical protein n=1 Tax=Halorubrum sp. AS12 TaxID=3409687 RepID=UPI003DA6FBCC
MGHGAFACPACESTDLEPSDEEFDDGGVCENGHEFRVPDRNDAGVFRCRECGSLDLEPN